MKTGIVASSSVALALTLATPPSPARAQSAGLSGQQQQPAASAQPSPMTSPRPGSGGGPPPPFTPVRWNEDYSYLKDPAKRTDFLDPLKFIPLNDEGDWYLSLGAQARYRYEYFNNFNFGAAGQQDDDGYHLFRLMYHADLHVGPNLRAFVQLIDAFEHGREPTGRPGVDENDFDFHQAFVDFKLPLGDDSAAGSVTLRGGRQNLLYGAQRLISPLDWTNTRRTFDGAKASVVFPDGRNTLDVFWVRPVIVDEGPIDSNNDQQNFYGLYDTLALPDLLADANVKLDGYLFYLDKFRGAFAQGTAAEHRWTVGTRLYGNPKPFDFDVEGTYQFGDFGDGDISAYSIAAEVGYTLAGAEFSPRLYLGFDIASGDDDPSDNNLETFNQLFPLGHAYFGFIDVIGRQNIIDLHPGVELTLLQNKDFAKKVTLRGDYHLFWRQSSDDAVYGVGGAVQRADTGTDQRFVGSEIDLLLNWQVDRHTAAYVGYSHFFAGDFIDATGAHQDIDFVYAAVTFTF